MKKIIIFISIFLFVFSLSFAHQEKKKEEKKKFTFSYLEPKYPYIKLPSPRKFPKLFENKENKLDLSILDKHFEKKDRPDWFDEIPDISKKKNSIDWEKKYKELLKTLEKNAARSQLEYNLLVKSLGIGKETDKEELKDLLDEVEEARSALKWDLELAKMELNRKLNDYRFELESSWIGTKMIIENEIWMDYWLRKTFPKYKPYLGFNKRYLDYLWLYYLISIKPPNLNK